MKTLKFEDVLVPIIINRKKYATFRVDDERQWHVGEWFRLVEASTDEWFALAQVTALRFTTFKYVAINEHGHEKFSSREEMLDTYSRYYGKDVTDFTEVKVIYFSLR